MGLRDAIKAKVKAALGVAPPAAASPVAPPAPPVAAPKPAPPSPPPEPAPKAATPAPGVAAPAPAAPAPKAAPVAALELRAVAAAAAVREGKAGTYAHGGFNVAVFRHAGRLFAIDNACAHEDGPIGEGDIEGNCVRCPYHDWQYDFTTGACITDPDRARATFEVAEREGQILLGAQLTPGSDARGGEHDDGLEVIIQ
jgi:nitrite reductase/ring-hydroxylating ferredoxin subunit